MDEVLIRNALNAMLDATKGDAIPIIRRLARVQARAALDTLASAPAVAFEMPEYAPDDISHLEGLASYLDSYARQKGRAGLPDSKALFEEIAKRLREYDVVRASAPAGDGNVVDHIVRALSINDDDTAPSEDYRVGVRDCIATIRVLYPALARPRAAVGEQSRDAEPTADSPWAKLVWFGQERSIPRCDVAIGERELAEALRTALLQEGGEAWMNPGDTTDSFRIDGTIDLVAVARLLQSPLAKVEGA